MKKVFRFLLSHSIFIAVCALALCFQTYFLLGLAHNKVLYAFVFSATICSYNFYWLLSKFSFRKQSPLIVFLGKNASYIILFVTAGLVMAWILVQNTYLIFPVTISLLLTLAYSLPLWPFSFAKKLKKFGFLKTITLAAAWAFVTVVLPAWPVAEELTTRVAILFFSRFSFMLLLCIIFDNRDVAVDKIHSLTSLATAMPPTALRRLTQAIFFLFLLLGSYSSYAHEGKIFLLVFLLFAATVYFVYYLSCIKKRDYYFYYFLVDGLMIVFALQSIAAVWLQGIFMS